MIEFDENRNMAAKVKIIGVGGGGNNALNTMISSRLTGVEFIAANTDAQALTANLAPMKFQLGTSLTKGLGAGANPEIGRKAALEDVEMIREILKGADMVFITAGLGGGTGTGGAPVIAEVAREMGALTVAIVTKPFHFEGKKRMQQAEEGLANLKMTADALITIPNQRLLSISGKNMTLLESFKKADEILFHAAKGISDIIVGHGIINLDFADVRAVMSETGMAMMGTGIASGENRSIEAAQKAISSPLLEDISIEGARGLLINITGGENLTLSEINEATSLIQKEAHEDANVIWGMVIDPSMREDIRITVIATGFGKAEAKKVDKPTIPAMKRFAQLPGFKDRSKEIPPFSISVKEGNRETPAFMRRVKASERFDELKLDPPSDFTIEDQDRFDIPTFLRKQAD
ncbi:MAG: cell division protein FtsZ [Deltaproteobacteria bacterium]|nr:cell division protein FtsZ [Deltaproteobacteria bacterium]MBM4324045.1 cell division protein FtsZ [Deltaproteobacteria bacterium]